MNWLMTNPFTYSHASGNSSGAASGHPPPQELWNERYATLPTEARMGPIPFVVSSLAAIPAGGWALDAAAGAGRHSLEMARRGWRVEAVDISPQGLSIANQRASQQRLADKIHFIAADIERPWLPHRRYNLILVSFFLYRPLFPLIKERLLPGGWLVYETFTVEWLDQSGKKRTPDDRPVRRQFLLERGELKEAFSTFEILFYDEGWHGKRITAQLLARKPL